jgi:hypothetical protein
MSNSLTHLKTVRCTKESREKKYEYPYMKLSSKIKIVIKYILVLPGSVMVLKSYLVLLRYSSATWY